MSIRRIIQIPRPSSSRYTRPITAHLFFAPHASKLAESTELILDIPGGGFVSMTPEHHEERLCAWAEKTGRPVLSLDYGKAPECECNLLYLFYISATPTFWIPDGNFGFGDAGAEREVVHLYETEVLSRLPERFLIVWRTLINFVTSQILTRTR